MGLAIQGHKQLSRFAFFFLFLTLILAFGLFLAWSWYHPNLKTPLISDIIRQRNLSKYKFENLSAKTFVGSPITIESVLAQETKFTPYLFSFVNDEGKKVTGQINVPHGPKGSDSTRSPAIAGETAPEGQRGSDPFKGVILLIRGYIDREIYSTGSGTRNAAAFFARNGFITIAPDFLGYGGSDPESFDILEARFEKPATVLSLLASLKYPILDQVRSDPMRSSPLCGRETAPEGQRGSDLVKGCNLFIWSHSNGGQIALSVLEITQAEVPTSLWAPVSIGFPDSILHFVDDLPDGGEYIRKDLEDFQSRYDFAPYSITTYFDRIHAPIQLHQGGKDPDVPLEWSENLKQTLLDLNLDLDYFYYPNSDHNLRPDWNTAISFTPMPKARINKNNSFVFSQNNIGFAKIPA